MTSGDNGDDGQYNFSLNNLEINCSVAKNKCQMFRLFSSVAI